MCIRDSAIDAPERAVDEDHRRSIRLAVDVHAADDQLLPQRCLLYTSDAADERSSVDLGGRRIIKKKTNVKR